MSQADFIGLLVWLAEGEKKTVKTQRRNVKCRTSSPMFILYSVPNLYIPKLTVIDWIGGSREAIPCICAHSSLLICQHWHLTSQDAWRYSLVSVDSFKSHPRDFSRFHRLDELINLLGAVTCSEYIIYRFTRALGKQAMRTIQTCHWCCSSEPFDKLLFLIHGRLVL